MFERRKTREVLIGNVPVGSNRPVAVQSMYKGPLDDTARILDEIDELAAAGCAIYRLAVPSPKAVPLVGEVAARSPLPIVADVHFDWRLAVAALEAGVAKVRVNPGNIRDDKGLARIARKLAETEKAVRLGVNSGSIAPRAGSVALSRKECAGGEIEMMVDAALGSAEFFRKNGCERIVLSIKGSDPAETIKANRLLASACEWPLHLGVTAAGPPDTAAVKSAVAMGALLSEGIGDTVRVSVSGPSITEIRIAGDILRALGLAERGGLEVISCPTCSRTGYPVADIAVAVRDALAGEVKADFRVAIMGCVVNGPGEAAEADLAVVGGSGGACYLYRGAERLRRIDPDRIVEEIKREIETL